MPRTDYPEHLIRQVSPKCCTLQLTTMLEISPESLSTESRGGFICRLRDMHRTADALSWTLGNNTIHSGRWPTWLMRSVICDSGEWDYSHNTIEVGQGGAPSSVSMGGDLGQQQHVGGEGTQGSPRMSLIWVTCTCATSIRDVNVFEYIIHVIIGGV